MNDTPVKLYTPSLDDIEKRIRALEQFEREMRAGNMLLFFVEAHDCSFIVAAGDAETACQIAATQYKNNNVEFLGRATTQYDKPQIVKWWRVYNWDKSEDERQS